VLSLSIPPPAHLTPLSATEQQVTLYPHRDTNNNWRIVNGSTVAGAEDEPNWATSPLEHVVHGQKVKLLHLSTSKHLHSHDVRAPISDVDFQNEVSAYGMPGFAGDANDEWILEIDAVDADDGDVESGKRLRTLRTKFRLRHVLQGCYLFSHKVKLPEWGFEQQEVTCNKNAVRANSLWFVETSKHSACTSPTPSSSSLHPTDDLLAVVPEKAPKVNYKLPGFLAKFFELQQVMWTTNAGLTDRHTFDSRPHSWPRLRRGIVSSPAPFVLNGFC
jgi:dolichyl-phosphate-mannose-protein mannosyltransferase